MQSILDAALKSARPFLSKGNVAAYIPALTRANPDQLGVAVCLPDGSSFSTGDSGVGFTIQSISKVFTLVTAIRSLGRDRVFERVGLEPSGNPFYSLVQLEYEAGRPRNPFINAGAMAISSLLPGETSSIRLDVVAGVMSELCGRELSINVDVYSSERDTGNRNKAVGFFMKHFDIIEGDVTVAVDTYFRSCSIEMTCLELARAGLFLSNHGVDPTSKQRILEQYDVQWINALMTTCGLYEASGEFACRVGVPGKSGVGGGILAIVPGKMSIAAFGPALDEKGNSIGAWKVLEFLSAEMGLSLYA